MTTTFDALNKLGNFMEVSYRRNHDDTAWLLAAWDDRREINVLWTIRDSVTPPQASRDLEYGWSWIYDYAFEERVSDSNWLACLAYVSCNGEFAPLKFPDIERRVQISADDYAAIVAAARGEA